MLAKQKAPRYSSVFSGITSGDLPIGGRCVLIRQHMEFDKLELESFSIDNLDQSDEPENHALVKYFQNYEGNNLVVKKSVGYDYNDLLDY